MGAVLKMLHRKGKVFMYSNLPSLFSLKLVGSTENVAKSTPWPQVQEAVYL